MAVVPAARAALEEQAVLQRGHVEKCKAWKTRSVTDFPALRHVLGIERWCSQRTCLRRPRPRRQKTKARHLGLDTLEGMLGPSFFHSKSAICDRCIVITTENSVKQYNF
jgi:hypothetical protein